MMPLGLAASIILVAKGDAGLVERVEPSVRDGDAVGVAREIGEYGLGSRERGLGVNHPCLPADRCGVTGEGASIVEVGMSPEEAETTNCMEGVQSGQEQPAEQLVAKRPTSRM